MTQKKQKTAEKAVKPEPIQNPTPHNKTEPKTEPTQLDRIESLLVELVQTNRKMHPNISDLMGGFHTNR